MDDDENDEGGGRGVLGEVRLGAVGFRVGWGWERVVLGAGVGSGGGGRGEEEEEWRCLLGGGWERVGGGSS